MSLKKEHESFERQEARKWRQLLILEQRGHCQACKQWFEPILEVHHVRPIASGGCSDKENMAILCPNCHAIVHLFASSEISLDIYRGAFPYIVAFLESFCTIEEE